MSLAAWLGRARCRAGWHRWDSLRCEDRGVGWERWMQSCCRPGCLVRQGYSHFTLPPISLPAQPGLADAAHTARAWLETLPPRPRRPDPPAAP